VRRPEQSGWTATEGGAGFTRRPLFARSLRHAEKIAQSLTGVRSPAGGQRHGRAGQLHEQGLRRTSAAYWPRAIYCDITEEVFDGMEDLRTKH
jgi:hypothetical protein